MKELELKERSNILVKMGAKVERGYFEPGYASVYGGTLKFINVPILGVLILAENFLLERFLWMSLMTILTCYWTAKLISRREYIRSKELRNMSIMEILTIYTPIPLVLPWLEATILMVFGIAYFLVANRFLWGTDYPRV